MSVLYDEIGGSYAVTRRPDPRMAAAVRAALADARSVVNVGAGAGAYEPEGLDVIAVEPSATMIAQRPADDGAARVIQASAEALPLGDAFADAAMAVLSDHHWHDRAAGLRELRRVARRRVVLVNVDPARHDDFWLTREYLPEFLDVVPERYREPGVWAQELSALFGAPVRVAPLPVPWDCTDGFYCAYWRRPEAYLDPTVRDNISVFRAVPAATVDRAVARLAADLESGAWARAHAGLLERNALDLGLCVVVAEIHATQGSDPLVARNQRV